MEQRFGFDDFWPEVYQKHRLGFDALADALAIGNQMCRGRRLTGDVQIAVFMLVRMTLVGMNECLILAGNGAGMGAMKITRGMFESAVMAEYLRLNPSPHVEDYLDYRHVLMWKRVQQARTRFTAAQIKRVEDRYNRVKLGLRKMAKCAINGTVSQLRRWQGKSGAEISMTCLTASLHPFIMEMARLC